MNPWLKYLVITVACSTIFFLIILGNYRWAAVIAIPISGGYLSLLFLHKFSETQSKASLNAVIALQLGTIWTTLAIVYIPSPKELKDLFITAPLIIGIASNMVVQLEYVCQIQKAASKEKGMAD